MANEAFQTRLCDTMEMLQEFNDNPLISCKQRLGAVLTACADLLACTETEIAAVLVERNSDAFVDGWSATTWSLLSFATRVEQASAKCTAFGLPTADWHELLVRKHQLLVRLVNHARPIPPPRNVITPSDGGGHADTEHADVAALFARFQDSFAGVLHALHDFYATVTSASPTVAVDERQLQTAVGRFRETRLRACLDAFSRFADASAAQLWTRVRAAQILRMCALGPEPREALDALTHFYANIVYALAVLASRLDGFRHEAVFVRSYFRHDDCIRPMLADVYRTFDLCLNDSLVVTEPNDYGMLVTNNLFEVRCLSLVKGFGFKNFTIQIVSEETANHIQEDLRSQKQFQDWSPEYPSAALVAVKNTFGSKRSGDGKTKSDAQNGARAGDCVRLAVSYESSQLSWQAGYPHLLCTTRHKERTPSESSKLSSSSPTGAPPAFPLSSPFGVEGKRDLFYFHVAAAVYAPDGRTRTRRTLSLPFTIATRRNQDSQVQRMSSSYTATVFWLYSCAVQDRLLIRWPETGMPWGHFKKLYSQYFRVNASVTRGLATEDMDLLKMSCVECSDDHRHQTTTAGLEPAVTTVVSFKNLLCPHLRYETDAVNVRFSVWRCALHLLQIFQDHRNKVRHLWEQHVVCGFARFDRVKEVLNSVEPAVLMARISFVIGGAVCLSVKMADGQIVHLEPLDFKRLQQRSLLDYLHDVSYADKIRYAINAHGELVEIAALLSGGASNGSGGGGGEESDHCAVHREIRSNVEHAGDVAHLRRLRFHALRIAVVTCQLPSRPPTPVVAAPPSPFSSLRSDSFTECETASSASSPSATIEDDLRSLMLKHGKTREDIVAVARTLRADSFS